MRTNLKPEEFEGVRIIVDWIGRTAGGRLMADIRLEGIDYAVVRWVNPRGDGLDALAIQRGTDQTVDLARGAWDQTRQEG
jgi:hypothetical protein